MGLCIAPCVACPLGVWGILCADMSVVTMYHMLGCCRAVILPCEQVAEAGHMVPMDQPKAALVMITGFLAGKDYETQPAGSVLVSAASVNQTTA